MNELLPVRHSAGLSLTSPPPELARKAAEIIQQWRDGAKPDAMMALRETPLLRQYKKLVLDLAYEEFCLREEGHESLSISRFCQGFDVFQESIRRQVDIHFYRDLFAAHWPGAEGIRWPKVGEQLAEFTLVEKLGEGGFSRVYLATDDVVGGRKVVVKIADAGLEEAGMLGRLAHRNIVPVYSARPLPESDLSFICMPYLGRATLCDALDVAARDAAGVSPDDIWSVAQAADVAAGSKPRRGDSYFELVLSWGVQLAGALAHAHGKGIFHGDLKPSNVLLTPELEPMLLDFNLAFEQDRAGCRQGGTLPYMSPEQLRLFAEPERPGSPVNARSDIFSLGVILYQLLTGALPLEPPREEDSLSSLAKRQREQYRQGHARLSSIRPDLDPVVARLIDSCLDVDPEKRPASAADLAAELARALQPSARLRRKVRAKPRRFALAAAALGLVLLGAGLAIATRDSYPERLVAEANIELAQNRLSEAKDIYRRAWELDPSLTSALRGLIRCRLALDEFSLAIPEVKRLSASTHSPNVTALLAYCYQRSPSGPMHTEAIARYRQAIDAGLNTAAVRHNLGLSWRQIGKRDAAMKEFDAALALNPESGLTYYLRAITRFGPDTEQARFPKGALEDLENALPRCDSSHEIFTTAAFIYAYAATFDDKLKGKPAELMTKAMQWGARWETFEANPYLKSHAAKNPEIARIEPLADRTDILPVKYLEIDW